MSGASSTASTLASRKEAPTPTVFVIDDDISVREALEALIQFEGRRVITFDSAKAFLEFQRGRAPGCLVLDVSLPDLNGLELQERLKQEDIELPVVFITGHGDVPMSVRAMKAGAIEFLIKPIDDDALLTAIDDALGRSQACLTQMADLQGLREDHEALSKREREVMALVVAGRLNKQIGFELGISEVTVKAHRGQVMRKMRARSLADLVHMASRLDVGAENRP